MADYILASSILSFTIPILLVFLSLKPTSSIPLPSIPQFDLDLLLIGDAQPVDSASSVQLTDPKASSSSGLLIRSKPFTFHVSNSSSTRALSFSTDFVFSISPQNGNGLAFIIVPADFPHRFSRESFGLSREKRFFGVEYDTFINVGVGDENVNHVGVDVGSLDSVMVSNVSLINLVLSSGMKLHSWVDYESSSKRLEVRLCEFGSPRPYNPLLAYQFDLGEMWKGEEVLVGLSSSSGNPMQKTIVYSWKFCLRRVPKWLHSEPLNPQAFSSEKGKDKQVAKKMVGGLRVVSVLTFAAFVVLLLRSVVGNSGYGEGVIPVKCSTNPGDFAYKKVNVVVEGGSGLDDIQH